jgi:hypothetical protein
MGLKSEVLALAFGALLIFVTFGNAHIYWFIGNLDTIFGLTFWRVLDVFYPVASAVVFLLYGWVKGNGLKFNAYTALLFATFVALLILVNIDDVVQVVPVALTLPKIYWAAVEWLYPVYSAAAFFLFGKKQETMRAASAKSI